ncbi:putative MOB kinase activator 2-like [Scophthalmus maximus]|uniref:Putative MOB kinase activator 2-like n=1 Tax=Scophthalmus maximus TaxID=52904 RepID=A0A2U9BWX3_SCOMX|nr:putative MOB kinase activator 2-like [Scophthalmus maximus]
MGRFVTPPSSRLPSSDWTRRAEDKTDMHSQRNSKNGLSCKMVLQAVGKVLR